MIEIEPFTGNRAELMALLLLADEPVPLAAYADKGDVIVARDGDAIVGLVLMLDEDADTVEFKNVAVAEDRHGQGIGRALLEHAFEQARAVNKRRVTVATVTADTGNLRFYQRLGFRMRSIERDVFTPDNGYPDDYVDGILMRDMVWFDRDL